MASRARHWISVATALSEAPEIDHDATHDRLLRLRVMADSTRSRQARARPKRRPGPVRLIMRIAALRLLPRRSLARGVRSGVLREPAPSARRLLSRRSVTATV